MKNNLRYERLFVTTSDMVINRQSINMFAGNFEMSRPAVSKHVKVLYEAGLILIKDQGSKRYCKLNAAALTI